MGGESGESEGEWGAVENAGGAVEEAAGAGAEHGPGIHATFINSSGAPGVFTVWDYNVHTSPSAESQRFHGALGDGEAAGPLAFYPDTHGAATGSAGVMLHDPTYPSESQKLNLRVSEGSVEQLIFQGRGMAEGR